MILDTILGGGLNLLLGGINNMAAEQRAEKDRKENYLYGEMAAENADKRTRALYADFYSPQAMLNQYKEAGLSPAMMYGGTPGQGGMSGASAAGAASVQTPFMPLSMLEGAQIANLMAQTEKTKEEAKNINTDTRMKELEKEIQELQNQQYKEIFTITNSHFAMSDGTQTSLFEMADSADTYDNFIKNVREAANEANNIELRDATTSEKGQETLRRIYMASNTFNHDISVLSSNKIGAEFQESIVKAMKKEGFADMNAKSALSYLKANIETNNLTAEQKESWNNLIGRLEKKNSNMKDIVVVLGMILNNAMMNYKAPAINVNHNIKSVNYNNGQ